MPSEAQPLCIACGLPTATVIYVYSAVGHMVGHCEIPVCAACGQKWQAQAWAEAELAVISPKLQDVMIEQLFRQSTTSTVVQ